MSLGTLSVLFAIHQKTTVQQRWQREERSSIKILFCHHFLEIFLLLKQRSRVSVGMTIPPAKGLARPMFAEEGYVDSGVSARCCSCVSRANKSFNFC